MSRARGYFMVRCLHCQWSGEKYANARKCPSCGRFTLARMDQANPLKPIFDQYVREGDGHTGYRQYIALCRIYGRLAELAALHQIDMKDVLKRCKECEEEEKQRIEKDGRRA